MKENCYTKDILYSSHVKKCIANCDVRYQVNYSLLHKPEDNKIRIYARNIEHKLVLFMATVTLSRKLHGVTANPPLQYSQKETPVLNLVLANLG